MGESCPNRRNSFTEGKRSRQLHTIRYLGLIFSSRNLWSKALSTLAAQAEKALSTVRKMIWKLGHPNTEVAFNIFGGKITPILCYGAELRGSEPRHQIEQAYMRFCKFISGLGQSAHSSAALGELADCHYPSNTTKDM